MAPKQGLLMIYAHVHDFALVLSSSSPLSSCTFLRLFFFLVVYMSSPSSSFILHLPLLLFLGYSDLKAKVIMACIVISRNELSCNL